MKKVSLLSIAIAIFAFIALYSCKSSEDRMKDALNQLENVVEEAAEEIEEAVEKPEVEAEEAEAEEAEEAHSH